MVFIDDLQYDEVLNDSQKYMSEKPVSIIGSGSSCNFGLPSMSDIVDVLKVGVHSTNDEWEELIQKLETGKNLENVLNSLSMSKETLEEVIYKIWKSVNEKDLEYFYEKVVRKEKNELSHLFRFLTNTADNMASIITTNYDRMIEYAANATNVKVITGFNDGLMGSFKSNNFKLNKQSMKINKLYEGYIKLLKVHGSLDWFQNSIEPISIPLQASIPDGLIPLIVAPGNYKYQATHQEPFRGIISEADSVAESAKSFLCIGYGFNDQHIQPLIEKNINQNNIPIIIINKSLTKSINRIFLENKDTKHIIFVDDPKGTAVYSNRFKTKKIIRDKKLWKLSEFINIISGGTI